MNNNDVLLPATFPASAVVVVVVVVDVAATNTLDVVVGPEVGVDIVEASTRDSRRRIISPVSEGTNRPICSDPKLLPPSVPGSEPLGKIALK